MRFKDKLAKYVFKKTIASSRAFRQTIAIDNAKTIGILYDATSAEQESIVFNLSDRLRTQGKEVKVFGFFNKKKLPLEHVKRNGQELITRSNLNWYGVPKRSSYAEMANEPFDILLNLYTWYCVPLLVISAASKAKFRIGKYFSDATNCFDFMVNIDGNTPLENFLTQIEVFSTKIHK